MKKKYRKLVNSDFELEQYNCLIDPLEIQYCVMANVNIERFIFLSLYRILDYDSKKFIIK